MSSQLTLNLDGTMVSITPQDGQRTILEIVTNNGISSLKSLHTDDTDIETKEPMQQRELPPLKKDTFENIEENVDNNSDEMDPIAELKMYDEEVPHLKPLNLEHVEEDGEDIVKQMTSDLDQPSAMNYGRHMELPEEDDELDFKPGPIVELENDEPYKKVELVDENDVNLEEYDNDSDDVSSISRILEHEKQLSSNNEDFQELSDDEKLILENNDINISDVNASVDAIENEETNVEFDSDEDEAEVDDENSESTQSNDDNAFLKRDRNKEQTTPLSFEPDEDDNGEDEIQF